MTAISSFRRTTSETKLGSKTTDVRQMQAADSRLNKLLHTFTRRSCHTVDQPAEFHITHVAVGKMQLSLSLVVYKQLVAV